MTYASKYRASRTISLLAILSIVYCFYRAIPVGLGGETPVVKFWLGLAFIASAIGIACAVASYYFRAQSKTPNTDKEAVAILGKASTKHTSPSQTTHPKTRQKGV